MMDFTYTHALELLKQLIKTPSLSRQEDKTANLFTSTMECLGIPYRRKGNNVWAQSAYFDPSKPTLLLNSHHDTVAPSSLYTKDPFGAEVCDSKLYGLGSNDAGASLVGLFTVFVNNYFGKGKYNLVFAATAEEEISGSEGIASILQELPLIDCAIVGEPTQMRAATAEKGLLVVDCRVVGKSSHAAHPNALNPIYLAVEHIVKLKNYRFEKTSSLLGQVHVAVSIFNAGEKHNVVPAEAHFTMDVRLNECYTPEQIVEELQSVLPGVELKPRSLRLRPSSIAPDHPLVTTALNLGIDTFGSPTVSDQALLPFPSIKMGIGDSLRSHTADEFIFLNELKEGIEIYDAFLQKLLN